ncbi:glycosyltransferase family 2 protein [Anthocerotibacter panamensis]|uniref:glycosyltransferase family 2 protein n=1 Tax=Anthocerotibacter panamensis TaxID=2857077 RepID=UPI001C401AE9|nr:glycosyltransferase family 2 protein [Anthocerotibacter panamensis]
MPRLAELPAPSPEKTGWPWTEQSTPLPATLPDGTRWPKITIVTPSYNQGQFLEETIRSVLLQGYPNLEYIVIDGGSTDNSVEVIRKYKKYLTYWVSEADRGQGHALNKGFARATGYIYNWLNSDDFFARDILAKVGAHFAQGGEVLYGNCYFTDADGTPTHLYDTRAFSIEDLFERNFIGQPTVFFRESLWKDYGPIQETLRFIVDYELWLRWALRHVQFIYQPEIVAYYRLHDASKSTTQIRTNQNESIALMRDLIHRGAMPAHLHLRVHRLLYGWCFWNYARLDLPQFWVTLRHYLQVSGKLPDPALLRMAGLALLGEKTLKALRDCRFRDKTPAQVSS